MKYLIILIIIGVSYGDELPTIDSPVDTKAPEGHEGSILGTMTMVYSKVRNAVKYAYDEIIYFERMNEKRKQIGEIFKTASERTERIFDKTSNLFSDPKDIFTTLEKMEDLFDETDALYYRDYKDFDRTLSEGEYLYDKAVDRHNTYTGWIIPNTQGVLNYIEGFFHGKPYDVINSEKEQWTAEELGEYEKYYKREEALAQLIDENWSDEKVRKSTALIAASTLSNSGAYTNWTVNQANNVIALDEMFSDLDGVNPIEMAATWYIIENTNANNKRILNSMEELKAMQALLSMDAYMVSKKRGRILSHKKDLNSLHTYLLEVKEENKNP